MKNLLHDIRILAILVLVAAGIVSCSDDLQETGDAEVNFIATIPATRTRSFGDGTSVNTLVVGIFNGSDEIDRKSFPVNGSTVDIRLTLAQNQTYSFVFWAYNESCVIYDIANLTAIKMNCPGTPMTFEQVEATDAFFAARKDVTVTGSCNYPVELVRPLAQINVGTTGNAAPAVFTAKGVPDTFHPFTNTVSGATDYTWNFTGTTTEKFIADDTEYNYLAMGYLFAPAKGMQVGAELTLTDGKETVDFPHVEIQANRRSNIIGGFTD